MIRVKLSDGLGNTQIRIFGPEIWVYNFLQPYRQVEQGFSSFSFLPNIWFIIDDFTKFQCLRKIIKYSKDLPKNEERPCSTCLKPIFP